MDCTMDEIMSDYIWSQYRPNPDDALTGPEFAAKYADHGDGDTTHGHEAGGTYWTERERPS